MFRLAVVYESGKRFIIPFEIVEKFVDKETVAKIKAEVKKEVRKL